MSDINHLTVDEITDLIYDKRDGIRRTEDNPFRKAEVTNNKPSSNFIEGPDLINRDKIFEKVTNKYRYAKGTERNAYRDVLDLILDEESSLSSMFDLMTYLYQALIAFESIGSCKYAPCKFCKHYADNDKPCPSNRTWEWKHAETVKSLLRCILPKGEV